MKHIFIVLLAVVLSSLQVEAQILQRTFPPGLDISVVRWQDNQVHYDLASPFYTIGRLDSSEQWNSMYDTYRTRQTFDFTYLTNIDDLDILSVTMYISTSYPNSNHFSIYENDGMDVSYQDIWDHANSGTALYQGLPCTQTSYADGAILDAVRTMYENRNGGPHTLFFTLVSDDESQNHTENELSISKLVVTYRNKYANPTVSTDYGQDPDANNGDFMVDNVRHSSPWSPSYGAWLKDENHSFHSYDHNAIAYSVDNRAYDRTPHLWQKNDLGHNSTNIGADWNTSFHYDDTPEIKANHYRYVINEFRIRSLDDQHEITAEAMTVGGSQQYSPYSARTKNGSDFSYDCTVPFLFYDSGKTRTFYFTGWSTGSISNSVYDLYGTYNNSNGTVTRTIVPDLHHKDFGGGDENSHIGTYNAFSITDFDSGLELPHSYISESSPTVNDGNPVVTVTVPASITYNNIQYVFVGWEWGGLGTLTGSNYSISLEFVDDNGFDYAKAMHGIYKAHLLSSDLYSTSTSSGVTCPQSQRKLDWVQNHAAYTTGLDGLYQYAYESGGEIWSTYSTDHAQTWSNEIKLGPGTNPCITSGMNKQNTYKTYVAWNGPDHNVWYYVRPNGYQPWSVYTVDSSAMPDNGAPVIGFSEQDSIIVVVWEKVDGALGYAIIYKENQNHPTCSSSGTIPYSGSNATAERPSICSSNDIYHIAWIEAGVVYHIELAVDKIRDPLRVAAYFYNYLQVSDALLPAVGAPSVTVDCYGQPGIAWGSHDPWYYGDFISFRQRINYNWGTTATMIAAPDTSYWGPSISYQMDQQSPNDGFRIAHNISSGGIVVQKLISGTWLLPVSLQQTEGLHPNLTDRAPQNFVHQAYSYPFQAYQGGAYCSQSVFTNDCLAKSMAQSSLVCSREISLWKDTTVMKYRLGELRMESDQSVSDLAWATGFDTLVVGKTKRVDDYLRTESFTVPQGSWLKYRLTCNKIGGHTFASAVNFDFQVVDAANGQCLGTLHQLRPSTYQRGRSDNRTRIALGAYAGRTVYLQVCLSGHNPPDSIAATDFYHPSWTNLPKEAPITEETVSLPSEYALSQNYPNPFNPATTISYALPENGYVSIVVTNMFGKTVQILVNQNQQAGNHSITFDASALPSGTYIYSMNVNGHGLTRTMTLLK